MKYKILSLLALLIGVYLYRRSSANDPLTVEVTNGWLRGKDNGHYYSYESIPYAEPPVGELRFEAPRTYSQKWDGEFDATRKPLPCMQWEQFGEGDNKLQGVEDCLTLNIYKPKSNISSYPVMVYLHGGCFMFGDVNLYSEDLLMRDGNMMLVKVVYRLGPLGFLSTEDDSITGNFGLKDQRLALQWIQENIAQFGGDPKRVMLTGFSAGGASTHYQVLKPQLEQLVKTAISFSGVALNPWAFVPNARKGAFKMGKLLGCPKGQSTLELKRCLQSKPARDIVSAVKHFLHFGYNPFTTFGPVVEQTSNTAEAFITQHPRAIIKSGNFSRIPWLAAFTKEDGGYNAAELLQINPKTGKEFMLEMNSNWPSLLAKNLFLHNVHTKPQEYSRMLKQKYLGDLEFTEENYWYVQEMYTDVLFRDGVIESLDLHRQYGQSPAYGYVYDNPADYSAGYALCQRKDIQFGTNHLDDLSLILHYPIRSPQRPDEKIISQKLIKMLVDFVNTEKLAFGDCEFYANTKESTDVKILSITKDNCQVITP